MTTIIERIVKELANDHHISKIMQNMEITSATPLKDNGLDLDSHEMYELAMILEEMFRIRVSESDKIGMNTLGDVVRLVENKLANQ